MWWYSKPKPRRWSTERARTRIVTAKVAFDDPGGARSRNYNEKKELAGLALQAKPPG